MQQLQLLLANKILITGVIGWATAQILKAIIYVIVNHRFEPERLVGDGGMPSCHSSTVTAVATATAMECGLNSPVFALAAIMAIIVMHDAMGVRLETGKQAKVLNDMVEVFEKLSGTKLTAEEKLKEFVGHTPLQVFAGFLVGLVVAVILHFLAFA